MKKENGITMVALVVTIVIIGILMTVVIVEVNKYTNSSALRYMQADIENLKNKAILYYNTYGDLPVYRDEYTDSELIKIYKNSGTVITTDFLSQRNQKDSNIYYEIDKSKIQNLTLNFGETEDVFIINDKTLNVYYINGIESDGQMQYTY